MKKLALAGFLMGMFGLLTAVHAADKDDVTGTWKVTAKLGKKDVEQTLKLENKDGKVTGTMTAGKGGEIKIEDGTFKDGTLKFSVIRERGDMKIVTKYEGKVTGDTIKGTATLDFNGKELKSDFEGKREKKKD
ncbi:MAG: hypothetical protein FJ304_11430 [Planctomycetes bacterium]|nr:hypothetical protein [Planctomycetota bacterium]